MTPYCPCNAKPMKRDPSTSVIKYFDGDECIDTQPVTLYFCRSCNNQILAPQVSGVRSPNGATYIVQIGALA